MIVSGDPDSYSFMVVQEPPVQTVELRELLNALELFTENYRLMHSGTAYGPQVETAAAYVRAKLRGL